MQKRLLFPALFALLLASACSNDFDVAAAWKEIPVTYCFLDAQADAQYIRVEKAFLDPHTSALKLAQLPDSLYYPANAITVQLEQLGNNGSVVKTLPATRVDGRTEGHPRDPGTFATEPNWLYKVNTAKPDSLLDGATYRIRIKHADGSPDVTGETTVPKKFSWADPITSYISANQFEFDTSGRVLVVWRTDSSATYFNVDLTIRYIETDPITGKQIGPIHELPWNLAKNVKRKDSNSNGTFRGEQKSNSLFEFLADTSNIRIDDTNRDRLRYFVDPAGSGKVSQTLTVEGGGRELETLYSTLAANAGITGAETVAQYSNMSAGYGIFCAKNSIQLDIRMGKFTRARINSDPRTVHLNFQK